MTRRCRTVLTLVVLLAIAACATHGWPTSSTQPVTALAHPLLEERASALAGGPEAGYSFYVFGDQRALADGEWQQMMRHIGDIAATNDRALLMIDTGDIVESGSHSDQFRRLAGILHPAVGLPYLVGVGNHEKSNNGDPAARDNAAVFLGYLDPEFGPDRMYYRKDIGPVRFLFLDSSDFVYGDEGGRKKAAIESGSRAEAQADWLISQLDDDSGPSVRTTIAVMHHPIVQSSDKHSKVAATTWNLRMGERTLPEILAEGGVDVILTGHTHTYERFVLTSPAGHSMTLVNVSGRPRNSFLWIGAGARRANDIAGREHEWLGDKGWVIPEGWSIEQRDHLSGDETNNFGIFTVDSEGGIQLEMAYLDGEDGRDLRIEAPVRIR